MLLGLEQVDPAVDQVEHGRHRALLLHLLLDEPLDELEGPVVLRVAGGVGQRLELLGRLGLLTHSTAGFVDPGFQGHVTLELSNVATLPIKLWPGMKIGQLCFFQLSSASENPYGSQKYGSRYQGQRGPTASRSHLNFHITDVGNSSLS